MTSYPNNFIECQEALTEYLPKLNDEDEQLASAMKVHINQISPVDRVCKTAECIYANTGRASKDALLLAEKFFAFASGLTGQGPFHGLQIDDRGQRCVNELRRQLGQKKVPKSTAPDPVSFMVIKVEDKTAKS